MNRRQLTTREKKYRGRLYGLKSQSFTSWKNQILFCRNFKMFSIFNLVSLEAAKRAKASLTTVAKITFTYVVVHRHRLLSHSGQVRARRVVANWTVCNLLNFKNENWRRTTVSWWCTSQNIKVVYSGQNQSFFRMQTSKFYLNQTLN